MNFAPSLAQQIMPVRALHNFLRLEASGGILLMTAAVLAMVVANTPLAASYQASLDLELAVSLGELALRKPLLLWINDGLMAVFFLLIGLEVKREILEGQLSSLDQVLLPGVAALGGFVVPAAIYVALNWGDSPALNGWAIPAATDIAFALGILSLFGNRVPVALKIFLMSLAIFDDLAAIVVIAIFYSGDLSLTALGLAALGVTGLFLMNWFGIGRIGAYVVVGVFVWICVLKSGVHATLAGVLLAAAVPLRISSGRTPLREVEHALHPYVAFAILPVFAFANAGLSFEGLAFDTLFSGVSVGIALGLLVGKPLGIMLAVGFAVLLGSVRLPESVSWPALFGASILAGIGFTMSLFIGNLAFEHGGFDYLEATRVGVLAASALSALLACLILSRVLPASVAVSRTPAVHGTSKEHEGALSSINRKKQLTVLRQD